MPGKRSKDPARVPFDVEVGKCVLGIDPGKSGGISIITFDGKVFAWGMNNKDRKYVADLMRTLSYFKPEAFIEKVHSRPLQSSKATFTFGMMFERVCMGSECFGMNITEVLPKVWQKFLGCQPTVKGIDARKAKKIHKNNLKSKVLDLFPGYPVTLSTADAILIGEYGRRLLTSAIKEVSS